LRVHREASVPAPPRIWDVIVQRMKRVSPENWASVPRDGASQVDHYVYGVPMRREGITEALTNDRYFEQEGFRALFRK
jgi:predicted nucleic acid-binding protein